ARAAARDESLHGGPAAHALLPLPPAADGGDAGRHDAARADAGAEPGDRQARGQLRAGAASGAGRRTVRLRPRGGADAADVAGPVAGGGGGPTADGLPGAAHGPLPPGWREIGSANGGPHRRRILLPSRAGRTRPRRGVVTRPAARAAA